MLAGLGKGGGQVDRDRGARNAANSNLSSQMAAISASLHQVRKNLKFFSRKTLVPSL